MAANNKIKRGHSRLKFHECDEEVNFGTFIHNGRTSFLQVKNEPDVCIKQNGPRPQGTDAIRAFTCNQDDMDFTFNYVQQGPTRTPPPPGVPTGAPSPSPSTPPEGRCDIAHFGTDCCSDEDCPSENVAPLASYMCEDKTCISRELEWYAFGDGVDDSRCLAVSDELDEVFFELCDPSDDSVSEPNHHWHVDTLGRIRSNLDISRCLTIGKANANGIVDMRIDSCDFNSMFNVLNENKDLFAINVILDFLHDKTYCVTFDEDSGSRVTATLCENASFLEWGFIDDEE